MSFEDRLDEMQNQWDAGEDNPFGPDVTSGVKKLQLLDAEVYESKSSGNLSIRWTHMVLTGDERGEDFYDYLSLTSEFGTFQARRRLQVLGFDPPQDVAALPDVLLEVTAEEPCYVAKVDVDDEEGFINVDVQRLLRAVEAEEALEGIDDVVDNQPEEEEEEPVEPTEEPEEKSSDADDEDDVNATRAAIRLAEKNGLDIADIEGTGKGGRVLKSDAKAAVKAAKSDGSDDSDQVSRASLVEFAQAFMIDEEIDDPLEDLSDEELIDEITGFEYEQEDLLENEVALLESIGGKIVE